MPLLDLLKLRIVGGWKGEKALDRWVLCRFHAIWRQKKQAIVP
jgi:hypothetical protein